MFSLGDIFLLCWAIYLGYWIINWRKVKPTKEKRLGIIHLRLIGIIVIVIAVLVLKRFHALPSCRFTQAGCSYSILISQNAFFAVQAIAAPITIAGLIIAVFARRKLERNWSSNVELKEGHELVTSGIYGYVRHPIYSGIGLMGLGTLLYVQSIIALLIYVFVFLIFAYRIKKEEELMTKTFPKEYPEYKRKVKALIPYIW